MSFSFTGSVMTPKFLRIFCLNCEIRRYQGAHVIDSVHWLVDKFIEERVARLLKGGIASSASS